MSQSATDCVSKLPKLAPDSRRVNNTARLNAVVRSAALNVANTTYRAARRDSQPEHNCRATGTPSSGSIVKFSVGPRNPSAIQATPASDPGLAAAYRRGDEKPFDVAAFTSAIVKAGP